MWIYNARRSHTKRWLGKGFLPHFFLHNWIDGYTVDGYQTIVQWCLRLVVSYFWETLILSIYSMVVSGSPKRWDRWHIIPQLAGMSYHLYTTYSPCLLGGYMLPIPPFRGTRNNQWSISRNLHHFSRENPHLHLGCETPPWIISSHRQDDMKHPNLCTFLLPLLLAKAFQVPFLPESWFSEAPIVLSFQTQPFSTSMIMGERVIFSN